MPAARDPDLEREFPKLNSTGGYEITSCRDDNYNCTAWAADDTTNWWEHTRRPGVYWPPVLNDGSIDALIAAFAWIGYSCCTNGDAEWGYEKIALFATPPPNSEWTHAAKRLSDGRWSSKCGNLHDIAHRSLEGVNCAEYGTPVQFMRRWWPRRISRWLRVRIYGTRS